MRNIKLIELLSSLSYHEHQAFAKYLSSGYFNTDDRVSNLYNLVKGLLQHGNVPDKKVIHKKLFPGWKYDDKKIRYLFSYLAKQLENFLALREFEKDDRKYFIHLQQSLSNRNAHKSYSFAKLQFETAGKFESAANYLENYQEAGLHQRYVATRLSRISQLDYESVVSNLDRFYFLRKLQLYCELINLRNVLAAESGMLLIEEINTVIAGNSFFGSKAIEIYYLIMLTLTEPAVEKHFEKLYLLLEECKHLFPVEDLNDMYQYVKNYCIKMINMGHDAYRQKLFGIYKSILSDTRIMNHEMLSQWEFKNIVTLGLRLKQIKWVQSFIKRFVSHLASHERKNALTYNLAMLSYYEKNYRQTVKLLREVEFSDLYYALDSRSLLLKVYFETDDMETLLYHIGAFKIFLRRNKFISAYQREIYRNFIRYALKLFRAGTSPKKLLALREEISTVKNISDRSWLLERADEMI